MLFVSNYMSSCFYFCGEKTIFGSSLLAFVLYGVYVFFMLFIFIYVYWFPNQFLYQIMFVSFKSNTTGVTSEAGTANPSGALGLQ